MGWLVRCLPATILQVCCSQVDFKHLTEVRSTLVRSHFIYFVPQKERFQTGDLMWWFQCDQPNLLPFLVRSPPPFRGGADPLSVKDFWNGCLTPCALLATPPLPRSPSPPSPALPSTCYCSFLSQSVHELTHSTPA